MSIAVWICGNVSRVGKTPTASRASALPVTPVTFQNECLMIGTSGSPTISDIIVETLSCARRCPGARHVHGPAAGEARS